MADDDQNEDQNEDLDDDQGEDLDDDLDDDSSDEDDVDMDLGDVDDDSDPDDPDAEKSTDTKLKELEEVSKNIKLATTHHEKLSRAITEAEGTLHRIRQEKKTSAKTDDEESKFTDAQLLGMMNEHKDDPAVMLQIIKHVSQESGKKSEERAVDATEIANVKKQTDSFVTKNWPEINEDGSDLRKDVDEAKKMLRIEDHPFSDYLGIAAALVTNLPDMITAAEERGKKTNIKDKNETNRKQGIKDNKLSDKGKKTGVEVTLSAGAQETAKILGLSPTATKIYKTMLAASKGKESITTEV
jgi:hypothetical protein